MIDAETLVLVVVSAVGAWEWIVVVRGRGDTDGSSPSVLESRYTPPTPAPCERGFFSGGFR